MESVLVLRRWGVAFGGRVVLANVHLDVASTGTHVLVGPAGAGKSTLLRTLAGLNDNQPALRVWGNASYLGRVLGEPSRPALVHQNARLLVSSVRENLVSGLPDRGALSQREQEERVRALLTESGVESLASRLSHDVVSLAQVEQRLVAIVRGAASGAPLLLVDEPTAGLDDAAAREVVALLRRIARDRAVVMITHQQCHARALGGTTSLLAGGRIQESAPTERFFDAPSTDAGRAFVETGSCCEPGPMSAPGDLDDRVPRPTPLPPSVRRVASETVGPRGFFWIEPGRIGGLPRPGVVADLDEDLSGLERLGVTVLVTLEERVTVPRDRLAAHGIEPVLFPIPDMHAPSVADAERLCSSIDRMLARGDVVAVHCLAGLGRTGTVLAAYLVWGGESALESIETVRAIRPRAIQSDDQADFLRRFAEVRARRSEASPPAG